MIGIETSAPGKVILAGEYAVLNGAPAICMAVNRRARVSISANAEPYHTVTAPGFSATRQHFKSIAEIADSYPLLAAVWQELRLETPDFLDIVLDSSGFNDAKAGKVGIGSSAALTVALTAALDQVAADANDIRSTAMAAHRTLQGGVGSGADVACSLSGGIIEYRMGNKQSCQLRWPPELSFALLWSGVPADTKTQLDKLAGAEVRASRAELGSAAQAVAQAWKLGDSAAVLQTLREYAAALQYFDVDHSLGIFDAGHSALATVADAADVVYKPCGAGGGDLGIAVSRDTAALSSFVQAASERGFKLMDLRIDLTGLSVSGDQQ
jgi:phosphomevalonate kinase